MTELTVEGVVQKLDTMLLLHQQEPAQTGSEDGDDA